MFIHLMNGRSDVGAFLEFANAAYVIAKVWKSDSVRVADSRGVIASGAAFMLAADVRALIVDLCADTFGKKADYCNSYEKSVERCPG